MPVQDYASQDRGKGHVPVPSEMGQAMGEKGNLPDTLEEVFTNLAEQGPQFWLSYEQFRQSRVQRQPAPVVAEEGAAAVAEAGGLATEAVSEAARVTTTGQPDPPAAG